MEITMSNAFSNLNTENSYLIATGKQIAKFYKLNQGKLSELPSVETHPPDYTDQEGTRRREGKGTIYGTASDYQTKDDGRQTDFLHAFSKKIKEISEENVDAIYLFSPSEIIEKIKNAFPKTLLTKIAFEYKGNFTKSHPNELLEKIKEHDEKNQSEVYTSHEASQILEETSTANLNEMGISRT
jgi:hypothetical protein